MGQKVSRTSDGIWYFYCPGCGRGHGFDQRWSFNGDVDRPTFRPSLLVSSPYNEVMSKGGELVKVEPYVCHSFVTDGKIEFLGDCSHFLAGQTVEMEDDV
ncbi:DUF6527 family protein [Fictibacillus sp. JL2B1089]|uniref:DUF6527 family protein n=1 Tax=Fictibacillus sp. JL2B1089 TaxID=3399565 RepID=UPI003A8C8369